MFDTTLGWARPIASLTVAAASSLAVMTLATTTALAAENQSPPTNRYIVVLHDSASSARAAATDDSYEYGVEIKGVYSHSISGYVADMTADARDRLASDPDVAYIEPDRTLEITDQVIPPGIQRANAPANPNIDIDGADDRRIDADVAVIDTGVSPQADLNVVASVDCQTGTCLPGGTDENGHGSHVAGTIGALDNGIGVVGVAPGARIHSVRVCNASGRCPDSAVLAGLDYVTAHADTIEVANMSLGGPGPNLPAQMAVARSVEAGIVHVVAAGNLHIDAADFSPANFPDVIAVSAIADTDGRPGRVGPLCARNQDDTTASFSNHGSVIDIAAPGVCIRSTGNDGLIRTLSGTSMASPHVAGAAALLTSGPRDPESRADVETVRNQLLAAGSYDYTDTSPDGIQEPLLDVGDPDRFPPPALVYHDSFDRPTGWAANPTRTDTATSGRWQRAIPQPTRWNRLPLQLATDTPGRYDLVTGAPAGTGPSSGDIDRGVTSVRSGVIALPAGGTLTLSLRWYMAQLSNATTNDYLRITVVGDTQQTVVLDQRGRSGANLAGTWTTTSTDITTYAGTDIRILVEAADNGRDSLLEAGIDDLTVIQH